MTCICGLCVAGRTWIGCDSATEYGDGVLTERRSKLRRRFGVIWGAAGDSRACDAILDLCVPRWDGFGLADWVRTVFGPSVASVLSRSVMRDVEIIIGGSGQLVCMGAGGAVLDDCDHDYAAIGSGGLAALAVLYSVRRGTPERRVRLALRASGEHVRSVRGPYRVLSC